MVVTILNSQGELVAFAMRVSHGIGTGPWIVVKDISLTGEGRRLYGSSLRLLVGEFNMICEDGLSFVGCKAADFRGPNAPVRFLALDVLNTDGDPILA
jgi:hypothetical protein